MSGLHIPLNRLLRLRYSLDLALDCIGDRTPRASIKQHAQQLDGACIELRYLLRDVQEAIKPGDTDR